MTWDHLTEMLCDALRANLRGEHAQRPPDFAVSLWNAFMALSGQRSYNAAGPNPIRFSEILAYCRLMGLPLEPHHLEALLVMDSAWLDHAYTRAKAPPGVKVLAPVSKQPISAALLDVVMG